MIVFSSCLIQFTSSLFPFFFLIKGIPLYSWVGHSRGQRLLSPWDSSQVTRIGLKSCLKIAGQLLHCLPTKHAAAPPPPGDLLSSHRAPTDPNGHAQPKARSHPLSRPLSRAKRTEPLKTMWE